jgi:hypothetical protein
MEPYKRYHTKEYLAKDKLKWEKENKIYELQNRIKDNRKKIKELQADTTYKLEKLRQLRKVK